jgi:hypothetical protein
MLQARICVLVALFVGAISPAIAEDYVVPTGVTVLTEEQLLNQIIGSTLVAGNESWVEYFELPTGDEKKGRIKGKAGTRGLYEGDWTIHGALMCLHFDKMSMVAYNNCYTTALDGDTVTWYLATGTAYYSRSGRIKLISGNYKNF